jgi:hypothetical protein
MRRTILTSAMISAEAPAMAQLNWSEQQDRPLPLP